MPALYWDCHGVAHKEMTYSWYGGLRWRRHIIKTIPQSPDLQRGELHLLSLAFILSQCDITALDVFWIPLSMKSMCRLVFYSDYAVLDLIFTRIDNRNYFLISEWVEESRGWFAEIPTANPWMTSLIKLSRVQQSIPNSVKADAEEVLSTTSIGSFKMVSISRVFSAGGEYTSWSWHDNVCSSLCRTWRTFFQVLHRSKRPWARPKSSLHFYKLQSTVYEAPIDIWSSEWISFARQLCSLWRRNSDIILFDGLYQMTYLSVMKVYDFLISPWTQGSSNGPS